MREISSVPRAEEADGTSFPTSVRIDLARYLPYRIHRMAGLIASPGPAELGDGIELSTRAWRAMMVLAAEGALIIGDIAKAIAADMASTTRAVRSLEERGLIVRRSPRADRRKQIIGLSEQGAAVHDRIARRRIAEEGSVMDALRAEERIELFRMLDLLEDRLTRLAQSKGIVPD